MQIEALATTLSKSIQTLDQHTARLDAFERSLTMLSEVPPQAASSALSTKVSDTPLRVDETALRRDITRLLRQELRELVTAVSTNQARAHAAGPDEKRVHTEEVANTPENRAAYDRSYDIVRTAFAIGRWTNEDAHALREAFAQLTGAQREEIIQFLIVAMNNGEIAVETTGPLF